MADAAPAMQLVFRMNAATLKILRDRAATATYEPRETMQPLFPGSQVILLDGDCNTGTIMIELVPIPPFPVGETPA